MWSLVLCHDSLRTCWAKEYVGSPGLDTLEKEGVVPRRRRQKRKKMEHTMDYEVGAQCIVTGVVGQRAPMSAQQAQSQDAAAR